MLCSVNSLGMLEIARFGANMRMHKGEIVRPAPFCNKRGAGGDNPAGKVPVIVLANRDGSGALDENHSATE